MHRKDASLQIALRNAPNRRLVRIGPAHIDRVSINDALETISAMLSTERTAAQTVIAVNAQVLDAARRDQRLATVLAEADLVIADGMSLVFASRLLGSPLPERVTGVDLMLRVCELAAGAGKSVYLLGGRPGAAEGAASKLSGLFPELKSVGTDCPPFGFENNPLQSEAVIRKIQKAQPDILFVGFGAPKQEFWMKRYASLVPVSVMMAVGGSFDMLAGQVPRAPKWIQNLGFEWLFRLSCEPRRLWKRYLIGNLRFIQIVVNQRLRSSR